MFPRMTGSLVMTPVMGSILANALSVEDVYTLFRVSGISLPVRNDRLWKRYISDYFDEGIAEFPPIDVDWRVAAVEQEAFGEEMYRKYVTQHCITGGTDNRNISINLYEVKISPQTTLGHANNSLMRTWFCVQKRKYSTY